MLIRTLRRLTCGALAALAIGWPAAPAQAAAQATGATLDPAAIDRYLTDYLDETGLPGAAVAVTRGDEVVHTAGYGHTAGGAEITARTPLPVASLSKSMTATAVVRLAEAGALDLDQPVRRYLPEFTMADPRAAGITVRQLLNQTSGMADSAYPDLTRPQPDTLEEAVAAMRGARLAADPGTAWSYHNPNYSVLGRLVEVVADRPFAEYLADEVFGPLGMADTVSVDTTDDMPDHARGHVRAYGMVFESSHPRWFTAGGFGVVSTAEDLARWLVGQRGERVISAEGVALTHTPPEGEDYAMGWRTSQPGEEPRRIEHTGQLLTHNAMQTLLPESGTGIAVVTNTGMLSGDDAQLIVDGLVELAEGRTPSVTRPFSMTADLVLGALTLLALGLATLGVVRSGRWARRAAARAWWRTAPRLLPYALPVLLFIWLTDLVGAAMHRQGTLSQLGLAWPALVIWAAGSVLAAVVVLAARGVAVVLVRRGAA
ncbi:serine hydrolase domain-containing protein [Streptomyces millisiae]|uniref:Serine hydrolase domain-containing protein n=1 Tax=Streptomyces millisiae TaxID=3075542 RepID=A0ABU2LPM8_9ACTN|nr:serine hydrolase domain-containing protein [Streptomyces sp. DSM 44918]MDT0319547.1 serine hydrolase domain-containing protein [Streptomyces sp. DSM 44918]